MTDGTTRERLLALLRKRRDAGGTLDEMVGALGVTVGHLSTVLTHCKDASLVSFVPEPKGRSSHRRRWFAAEFGPAHARTGRLNAAPCRAPGFFTALMRQHDWPKGWMPSAAPLDKWSHQRQNAQAGRAAEAGFSAGHAALGLEGAREHVVRWQAKAAATIAGGAR